MENTSRTSILIVDDEEEEIRKSLFRHFTYLGYSVETAANGVEALNILSEKHIEVMITDIIMPEMKGIDLLKTVRDRYPTIQSIVITGFVTVENLLSALKYGANTCVFKPIFDVEELAGAVTKAINNIRLWQRKLHELQGMKKADEEK